MRPLSRKRVAALLVAAVLAAAVPLATGPNLPTVAAHTERPSTWECNHPGWQPGFGTHPCHTLSYHYTITSFFRRNVALGTPGSICSPATGVCTQTTASTCDSRSQRDTCPAPSGWSSNHHTSSQASGPYSHAAPSTVTFGCSASQHRHGSGCHSHPLSPPPSVNCGSWHPHENGRGRTGAPTRGGNPSPPTPPHNTVRLTPCGTTNPVVINPPTTPPTTPTTPTAPTTPPVDPILDANICLAGVDSAITETQRQAWAADVWWETLAPVGAQGEPGEPWPPHPDVPGAASWLVVSKSPVWPVVAPEVVDVPWAATHGEDGCPWLAVGVQTRMEQLLPWRAAERRIIDSAHLARPDAGLGSYLRRWDNLDPDHQTAVIANQPDHDFTSPACALVAAAVSADSQAECSWELPVPGVWRWQARACFEADIGHARFQDCAPLASGVAWFKRPVDYTQGITLTVPAPAGFRRL